MAIRALRQVGWREWVRLPDLGPQWFKAKIDTGARSSSLHAFDLEHFERDGVPFVRFAVHPKQRSAAGSFKVEVPLAGTRSVKSSSGATEDRPMVRTTLWLGDVRREIELTLSRRDDMGFRMLIGREALRDTFAVEPHRSFRAGVPPKKGQRDAIVVGGGSVQAGTVQEVGLPISMLASGTHVGLNLLVVHGVSEGPTVWINAAVHGDEINGVDIVRRVLRQLDPKTLRGTVIAVPIVNVHGFVNGDRYLPDRRDLNRSFPGSASGPLARRIAHLLMNEVVKRCSVGIDLHTGSDGRTNLPQIRADLEDPETARLASSFGCPIMVHATPREGSLRSAGTKAGAKVMVFEGGEAWRFDRQAIEVGTRGVLQTLAALDMIDADTPPTPTRYRGDRTRWVRARRSGLVQLECAAGDLVEKGQVLGLIHDSAGQRLSKFRSPLDGLVIGLKLEAVANRGDALVHVASVKPQDPT